MRRTFNYTNRQRIPESCATFRLRLGPGGRRSFDAAIDLTGLELPGEAKVYIEAFFGRSLARFDFGTVASLEPPVERWLDEVEFADRLTFRIKVVDESRVHGRILALADAIDLELEEEQTGDRRSLLKVSYTPRLGEELWRVRFTPTGPLLEVNSTIPSVETLVQNDRLFAALVRPPAMRSILERLLLVDNLSLEDAGFETWQGQWLLFAQGYCGAPLDPQADTEERVEWIEEAVRAFAAQFGLTTAYIQTLSEQE